MGSRSTVSRTVKWREIIGRLYWDDAAFSESLHDLARLGRVITSLHEEPIGVK